MGKGDKKSRRGKIVIGSFGVRRRKASKKGKPSILAEVVAEIKEKVKKVVEKKTETKAKAKPEVAEQTEAAAPVKPAKKAVKKTDSGA
jgi:30S ribosomal protein S31